MSQEYCEKPCDICPIEQLEPLSQTLAKRALREFMDGSTIPGVISPIVFEDDTSQAFSPYVLSDAESRAAVRAFILICGGDCTNYQHPSK